MGNSSAPAPAAHVRSFPMYLVKARAMGIGAESARGLQSRFAGPMAGFISTATSGWFDEVTGSLFNGVLFGRFGAGRLLV